MIDRTFLKKLTISGLLVLATAAAYWRIRTLSFVVFDDAPYVTDNPHIRNGPDLAMLKWSLTPYEANWHPLTWISHALDYRLFALDPVGHHMTSLVIHTLNVILLFWILQYATGAIWRSGWVAALFAIHPLNVESVAWVAERKNVLSTLFWLLTIWAYIRYVRGRTRWRYALVIVFLALGLMSKPMLVTAPFTLLLLDYWPLERLKLPDRESETAAEVRIGPFRCRRERLTAVVDKLPMFFIVIASSVVTFLAQRRWGAVASTALFPFRLRIGNAIISYVAYLRSMVWPARLAIQYPFQYYSLGKVAIALMFLLSVTGLALWQARRFKYLAVGWLWYLVTLVPVIGIVQVGRQARADRYTYVPLIGVFIVLVWGAHALTHRSPRAAGAVSAAGLVTLAVLGVATVRQTGYWRNWMTLYEHAERANDYRDYELHYAAGNLFANDGRLANALEEYSKVPSDDPSFTDAQAAMGMVLVQEGQLDGAIGHFKSALAANPRNADANNRLGAALMDKGLVDDAIPFLSRAVEINSMYGAAYANLGAAYDQKGNADLALSYYEKALNCAASDDPRMNRAGASSLAAQVQCRIGDLLARSGRTREAIEHYAIALQLEPGCTSAREALARLNVMNQ